MKIRSLLLAAASLHFVLPRIAQADVTYTYTGNHFNYFSGTLYGPEDYVHGSITFSDQSTFNSSTGLASYSNIVDYSFTDGVFNYTFANADQNTTAGIQVDAQGRIITWSLFLDTYVPHGVYTLVTTNDAPRGFMDDFGEYYNPQPPNYLNEYGEIDYDPGTWSGPNAAASTPELSSLTLLGTGLVGVGRLLARRRRA